MRISDDYRAQNAELHKSGRFGGSGHKHARAVARFAKRLKTRSVLDYGCGQATLGPALPGMQVQNYDPAVAEFAGEPVAADLVVCTDVLEHVEPECLGEVLTHIRSLAKRGVYFAIALRLDSKKTLPDGRNPHLIVKPSTWWLETLRHHFRVGDFSYDAKEIRVECRAP